MKRFEIGTNLIEDCETPVAIAGVPLFSCKVGSDGIKLTFKVDSPPANTAIEVEDNEVKKGNVEINAEKHSASISLDNTKLIEVVLRNDTAIIQLDLRPLGLHVYSDKNALHIGGAQLSYNTIRECKTGIAIGE